MLDWIYVFYKIIFPWKKAMSAMFVNWAPALEKSSLIGFAAAGSWLGNVVALPLG